MEVDHETLNESAGLKCSELEKLLDLASDIEKNPKNTPMPATTNVLPLFSMSQVPVPVSVLKLL